MTQKYKMKSGNLCISICAKTAAELIHKVAEAEPLADIIELRFDCLPEAEIDLALDSLPVSAETYLITMRPSEQGGNRELSVDDRKRFWANALPKLDKHQILIDHESDMRIENIAEHHTSFVSQHDFDRVPEDLAALSDNLSAINPELIKLAVAAKSAEDAIPLWKLLKAKKEAGKEMIPIAMGEGGKWTRILGPAHGAFLTFAALSQSSGTAPGQISISDMTNVFRVKELSEKTQVFGIIAGDTSYSMSPYIHNAAFSHAKMDRVFLPFQTKNVASFLDRMVRSETREIELDFGGFSVTNPHKQAIMPLLDEIDDTAKKIGAVNTVKIADGKLHGSNTDAAGFISPLIEHFGELKGSSVAVVGAGGAARACIYALKESGADVTVFARDVNKASPLIDDFGVKLLEFRKENNSPDLSDFDIIVNTTPLGTRGPNENQTIFTADELSSVDLVYDLNYVPEETLLLREAKTAGCKTLGGLEMLIGQAVRQFETWTGITPSREIMESAARRRLAAL